MEWDFRDRRGGVMKKSRNVEIKVNIEDNKQPYIDNLILGLAHSGYDVYFSYDNKEVCFTGWSDELITYTDGEEK